MRTRRCFALFGYVPSIEVWILDAKRGEYTGLHPLHFVRGSGFAVIEACKVQYAVNNQMAEMLRGRLSLSLSLAKQCLNRNHNVAGEAGSARVEPITHGK